MLRSCQQEYKADRCADYRTLAPPVVQEEGQTRSAILIVPGFGGWTGLYSDMVSALRDRGHPEVAVVPVSTHEWLPNAFAGRSFAWYLSRVQAELTRLFNRHGPVSVIAHSQGGVLALILLGSQPYDGVIYNGAAKAEALVTLGTGFTSAEDYPFRDVFGWQERRSNEAPLPADLPAHEADQIRKRSLAFAKYYYPDASRLPDVRIACVAGCCEEGQRRGLGLDQLRSWIYETYSLTSYRVSLKRSQVVGDGVTPTCLTMLPGSSGVIIFEGVRHMNIFPFYGLPWYGSPEVVAVWDKCLR
ncbi:g6849 [Coccomyxa elongata]